MRVDFIPFGMVKLYHIKNNAGFGQFGQICPVFL